MFKINKIIRRMRKNYLDKNLKKKKEKNKRNEIYYKYKCINVYLIIKSEYKN